MAFLFQKRTVAALVAATIVAPLIGVDVAAADVSPVVPVQDTCTHVSSASSDATALGEAVVVVNSSSEDLQAAVAEVITIQKTFETGSLASEFVGALGAEAQVDLAAARDAVSEIAKVLSAGGELSATELTKLDTAVSEVEASQTLLAKEAAKLTAVVADFDEAEPVSQVRLVEASLQEIDGALAKSLVALNSSRLIAVKNTTAEVLSSYIRPIAEARSSLSALDGEAERLATETAGAASAKAEAAAKADALIAGVADLATSDPLRAVATEMAKVLSADASAIPQPLLSDSDAAAIAAAHPLGRPALDSTVGLATLDGAIGRLDALTADLDSFTAQLDAVAAEGDRASIRDAQLSSAAILKAEVAESAASLTAARALFIRHVEPAARTAYKPATVDRPGLAAPFAAEAKALADASAGLADSAGALAGHASAVKVLAGDMDASKVDAAVALAVLGGMESATVSIGATQDALGVVAADLQALRPVSGATVRALDEGVANLKALQVATQAAQAELAVNHAGETEADVAVRTAASAELTKTAATLEAAVRTAEAGVAIAAKQLSAADAAAREPVAASLTVVMPHAANAAAMTDAKAGLNMAVVDAEAAVMASVVAGEMSAELRPAVAAVAKASSDLRLAVAAADVAAGDTSALIANGARLTAKTNTLAPALASVAKASAALTAARAVVADAKVAEADVAAKTAALASVDRIQATADARTTSLATMREVAAKYSYLRTAVKEPIVKEPVVREPIVKEPVVSEPVVREPVVSEPIVREPIAKVPVATTVPPTTTAPATASKTPVKSISRALVPGGHTVVEGETLVIPLAELDAGTNTLTVAIDALAEHGTVTLVRTANGCELHFASELGCVGTDVVTVDVEIDGVIETVELEIEITAASTTTSTSTTTTSTTTTTTAPVTGQRANTLAFTGSWSLIMAGFGSALVLLGVSLLRVSRRNDR